MWRGHNHYSRDNLQQDLADRRMANLMDQVLSHHSSQERQPEAMPELPNNQSHQIPMQSHAEDPLAWVRAFQRPLQGPTHHAGVLPG